MALTDTLRILITANGAQAASEFRKVGTSATQNLTVAEKSSKRFGASMSTAGIAAASFGAAAVAGLYHAAQAASESQLAVDKLNLAFQNSPVLVGQSTDALVDQANALQNTTVYSDEATVNMDALLATFRLTEQQIESLAPLVQDLASFWGTDLATAAKAVGKAMQGNIGALQRQGIIIDQTAYATDRFGAILSALRENAGGFAAEEGASLSGQLEIAKNKLGELEETIGRFALPGFIGLAAEVTTTTNAVGGFVDILKTLAGQVPGLGTLDDSGGVDIANARLDQLEHHIRFLMRIGQEDLARQIFNDRYLPSYIAQAVLASGATGDFGAAAGEAATQVEHLTQSLSDQIDEYLGITQGIEESRDALTGAIGELGQSLHDNGQAWQGNSDQAIANREAARAVVEQYAELTQSIHDNGGSQARLNQVTNQTIGQLRQMVTDGKLSEGQFHRLRDSMLGVPGRVHTIVDTDVQQALADIENVHQHLLALANANYTAHIHIVSDVPANVSHSGFQESAGGTFTSSGPGIVAPQSEEATYRAMRRALRDEMVSMAGVGAMSN